MAASKLLLLSIHAFILSLAVVQYSASGSRHGHHWWPAVNVSTPSLEYYVQVIVGTPYTGVLVPALNPNVTNSYGDTEAFQFNLTEGTSNASKAVGYVYGFTVQVSYTTVSHEVEVEVIRYDDGAGLNGTFSLQGLINLATNEIAVIGGTGSFRGVRGYAIISFVNPNVYHHAVYFL